MATIIRPADRSEAVVRLPSERKPKEPMPASRRAPEREPDRREPEPDAPAVEPGTVVAAELSHAGAVAAATIADTDGTSLVERALKAAQANAEQQAERLRDEARRQGHEEGLAAGAREAQAALDEQRAQLGALADSLAQLREQLLADAEDKLVELVFEAVTRLLGEALSTREAVVAMVRQVLQATRQQDKIVTIRLSPADFALLGGTDHAAPQGLSPGVAIVADPKVTLGGCLIDTAQGALDGRLEIQLERLKAALLEARQGQRR